MFGYIMVYQSNALSLSGYIQEHGEIVPVLTANPHEPNLDHKKRGSHHHTMGPFIAFICIYPPKTSNMVGFFKSQNKPLRYGKIRIFSSKNWWIFQLACAIMPPMLIPMMCTFSLERSRDVFKETGDSTNAGSAINKYVHIFSTYHI